MSYMIPMNENSNITERELNHFDVFEEAKFIDDIKRGISNTADLWAQWRKAAGDFVKHKWIYRYIDEKQKAQLEKHYEVLCNEKTTYSAYKKSFNFICKFMGLPNDKIIIENMVFTKDKQDKDQWELALKYSKGLVKVRIPDGVRLIHVSPVKNIRELIPSFRSKTTGKYMYPSKRVFFTVAKEIKSKQAGLEGQERSRYTPKEDIKHCYIDPTYSDFASGAVYVDTETPIPVENFEKKMFSIFKKKEETKK